jgi:hypothetical protein
MTNNELSKKILLILNENPGHSVKFNELAVSVGEDKKRLALNLFYLEINGFIEIRGVYNSSSVLPEIYFLTLRPRGVHIACDENILEAVFPSEMEHCMADVPAITDNLLRTVEFWASGDESKKDFQKSMEKIFKSDKFEQFIGDIYGRHKPR